MRSEAAVYRRVLRRETHAARTGPALTLAIIALAVVTSASGLIIWGMVDPDAQARALAHAGSVLADARARVGIVAAGAVAVLLALLLIAGALLPGRRARRARTTQRVALVVDDGVLADAAADRVAAVCGIASSKVSVAVRRRGLRVRVVPISGVPVDTRAVETAAAQAVADLGLGTTARATIADSGVVG